jgi:hypothetical protein
MPVATNYGQSGCLWAPRWAWGEVSKKQFFLETSPPVPIGLDIGPWSLNWYPFEFLGGLGRCRRPLLMAKLGALGTPKVPLVRLVPMVPGVPWIPLVPSYRV